MDTLFLINSNLKFKKVNKDRLFYDQYSFCMGFTLAEVSCLRELNHEHIDIIIERRRQWRQVSMQHWGANLNRNIVARGHRDITDEIVQNLHTVADLLLNTTSRFKLVTSVNSAWLYTNDYQLLQLANQLGFLESKQYSEAQVSRPKDTIRLTNPKHANRAYLANVKLTSGEKEVLLNFFQNQQDYIRISPSLTQFLEGSFHRTQDYFFFDYTGDTWLTMLALIRPGLIRKIMSIIAR